MKLSTLSILCLVLFFACGDPCDDIDCGPNGTCIEGECNCDQGYSGVNCEINVCDSINCNNGDCNMVTGECMCDEGYEGSFCDTEIRAKYLGTYSGDFTPCLGDLVEPDQIPAEIGMLSASVSADPNDINLVEIRPSNALLAENMILVNPAEGNFIIPVSTTSIEIEEIPFPLSITVSGSGKFIDENSFEITMNIIVPLIQPISCTILMTRI